MMSQNNGTGLPFPEDGQQQMPQTQQQQQQQQQNSINQFSIDAEDVSFQPVDAGFVGSGAMDQNPNASSFQQPLPYHVQQQQQQQQQQQGVAQSGGWFQTIKSCFQISTLQMYFDVDTEDVKNRLEASVRSAHIPDHFRTNVLNCEGKGPDLYGPVWICLVLMFFLSVTANTKKYLHNNESMADIEYDITHVFHALSILLCFTFVLPTVIYIMIRCLLKQSQPFSLVDLISLYGYSLVPFIPATVLCLIPVTILEWLILLGATGLSAMLILRNTSSGLLGAIQSEGVPGGDKVLGSILMFMMGCHFVFCLILKFTFYRHHGGKSSSGSSDYDDDDDVDDATYDNGGGTGAAGDDVGDGRWF